MKHSYAADTSAKSTLQNITDRRQFLLALAAAAVAAGVSGCASHPDSSASRLPLMVSPRAMAVNEQWVSQNLLSAADVPPFSFVYSDQASSALLPTWTRKQTVKQLDNNRTEYVIIWTTVGLRVKCVALQYRDYPAVQWTVYFKNTGTTSTPILKDIQALDAAFSRGAGAVIIQLFNSLLSRPCRQKRG